MQKCVCGGGGGDCFVLFLDHPTRMFLKLCIRSLGSFTKIGKSPALFSALSNSCCFCLFYGKVCVCVGGGGGPSMLRSLKVLAVLPHLLSLIRGACCHYEMSRMTPLIAAVKKNIRSYRFKFDVFSNRSIILADYFLL